MPSFVRSARRSRTLITLTLLTLFASFAFAQSFMTRNYESRPLGFAINRGDFNNDGILDVVVGDAAVSVFLGNADGTLRAPIRTDGPPAQDMAVGDFNHDGKLDVAVIGYVASGNSGILEILLGNGDGSFRTGQSLPLSTPPSSVTVGDFDNDGNLDLAVATDRITIFAGHGDGTFSSAATTNVPLPSDVIRKIRVGDFDADGRVDIAVQTNFVVDVLFNDGNLSFTHLRVTSVAEMWDMTPVDVNQDSFTDLVITFDGCPGAVPNPPGRAAGCPTWAVYLSPGDGTRRFRLEATQMSQGVSFLNSPTAADINGDGINDLVMLTFAAGQVSNGWSGSYEVIVWLGNANETYQTTPLGFITGSDKSSAGLVPGDFNRDGRLDFAVVNPGDSTVSVLLNAIPRAPCQTYTLQPSVTVCKPQDYTYSTSPVFVTARTSDNVAVTAMQVYIDNVLFLHSGVGASLDQFFNLPPGDHFIVTKAWDMSGRNFRSDRHVTVFTGTPGETCAAAPLSVNVCSPGVNATTTTSVRVFAAGSSDRPITSVQVYLDNVLAYHDESLSNYVDHTFPVTPGSHFVVVKVWDASGRTFTESRVVTAQ